MWYKMRKKRPPLKERVLLCGEDGEIEIGRHINDHKKYLIILNDGCYMNRTYYPYWAFLPEPPTAEEDD